MQLFRGDHTPVRSTGCTLLIYWLLFAYFAVAALVARDRPPGAPATSAPGLILGAVLIAALVGFRYEVGADWFTYERLFSYARLSSLERVLRFGEPGYQILNWTIQNMGLRLWAVNIVCGSIFAWGLHRLCRIQPSPYTAMLVAIPYLVIVVAMGYTRQSVAIGILMAGLASLSHNGSLLRFAAYVAAAALFHKTAVAAFPLAALTGRRSPLINVLLVTSIGYFMYDFFLEDSLQNFVKNYVKAEYSSQGALIRVLMNLVPATLVLTVGSRLGFSDTERKLWRNFALASLALLVLVLVSPSTTAVDRIALYILPIQIAVLSRVPRGLMSEGPGKLAVIAYSLAVQFVWLNFAAHADFWVPYQFFPLS
jgi:hypothetical protein